MKRALLGMMAMMMLAVSGCGDTSIAVVVPVISSPSITSHVFTQDRVAELISGSVAFQAPDSDIDTMTVVALDPRGLEASKSVVLINLPGVIQGTIPFSINYRTFPSETFAYTFIIYLTDFNGNRSNQAVDAFFVP
jgi:hypothetical protein